MADIEHVKVLGQGIPAWNDWRKTNPLVVPDLRGLNLGQLNLTGADFSGALLTSSKFGRTLLSVANLTKADFSGAAMYEADLRFAEAVGTNFSGASLFRANLNGTNLTDADLTNAELSRAQLIRTNLSGATLDGCHIYGIAAWDLKLDDAKTRGLVISMELDEPRITIDDIEVAQFVYLLIENKKIRKIIDSIASKVVLILGRFTPERKRVLDRVRDRLRTLDYVPVIFDFEKPVARDTHETVTLLARMSRFIISDITDATSVREELAIIVPDLPSVPVLPILESGSEPWFMSDHVRKYPWMMEVMTYDSTAALSDDFEVILVNKLEGKIREIRSRGL